MNLPERLTGPEGDLLGLMRLQGGGFTGQGRDERLMALQIRLQSPETLEAELRRQRVAGWRAMVVLGEPRLFKVLGRAPGDAVPLPLPVTPNLQGFMREAVEYGMVGAGLRRARRVGPWGLAALGLRSMGRLPGLWRRDFPTMLRSFIELELAEFARFRPPLVFLHPQMTDLALAMDNPRIPEAFAEAVRHRTGAALGLVSYNPGPLAGALTRWGLSAAALLIPREVRGIGLQFSDVGGRASVREFPGAVWGLRREWLRAPGLSERQDLRAAGLTGFVRDDALAWEPGRTEGEP